MERKTKSPTRSGQKDRFSSIEDIERASSRVVESIQRAVEVYDVSQATLDRCVVRAAACGFTDPDFVSGRHKDWYSEVEAIRESPIGGPYNSRVIEARRDPDDAFVRWFDEHVRRDDYYLSAIVPGSARAEAAGLLGDAWVANTFLKLVWPREIALARVMRLGRQKQKAAMAHIFLAQAREQPAMVYVGLARFYRELPGGHSDLALSIEGAASPDDLTVVALAATEEGPNGPEIDFDALLVDNPLWLRWLLSEEGDVSGELNRLPRDDYAELVRQARLEATVDQKEEMRRRLVEMLRNEETRRGPWLDVSFVNRARALGFSPNQYVAAVDRLQRYRVGTDPSLDDQIDVVDAGGLLMSWLEAHSTTKPEPETPRDRDMKFARIDVDGVDPNWMGQRLPASWRLFDHVRWDRMTRWRRAIAANKREIPTDLAVDYAFFLIEDVRRHPVADEASETDGAEEAIYA